MTETTSEYHSTAARLAAALIDDLDEVDCGGMWLHLKFTVDTSNGYPDDDMIVPVTFTREAHWDGGEWHWSKTIREERLEVVTYKKRDSI